MKSRSSTVAYLMVLPWKTGNNLILGIGKLFAVLGRRISDGETGVMSEDHPGPFGLVSFVTGLWNKATIILFLRN